MGASSDMADRSSKLAHAAVHRDLSSGSKLRLDLVERC